MEDRLSCNVTVHEEDMEGNRVFVVECEELGVSDYGNSINEAIENLKLGIGLFLEEVPEKKELLMRPEPLMVTRLFL